MDTNPGDLGVAYEIFKPINDKLVSKAEVAQLLAVKLNEASKCEAERKRIVDQIINDHKLNYLVEAIIHASPRPKALQEVEK
ncbi:hypothetical protein ACSS6N_14940 [Peribacillus frigoritolerans]|uniref:hypothetical protein n=1 Tax=Peribacillus frigoritolerans TaxID=450367 RepID=UPI003F862DE3